MTDSGDATRRQAMAGMAAILVATPARAQDWTPFVAEAFRQREAAVVAGDQPYGAVLVVEGRIAGLGPSRVVAEANPDAHAERVALRAAQAALGTARLEGATIVSTSVPCPDCQRALARAGVGRMIYGREARDAGRPRAG